MFNKICIKPDESTFPTDFGLIAENLLYYQEVNLIVSSQTIPILLYNCGLDTLIELLTNRNLRIILRENYLGVSIRKNQFGIELKDVDLIYAPNLDKEEAIFRSILTASGKRGHSKRATQKLLPLIQTITYQENICDLIREDLKSPGYVKQAIVETIKLRHPSYNIMPQDIRYELIRKNEGYFFTINANDKTLNQQLDTSSLLLNIMDTRGDMHLASELGSEISTNDINIELMKIKFHELYKKISNSSNELWQFNNFILSNGYAIRETINNGQKDFNDFFKILDKADKFRNWLNNINDDKSLIKEYHDAVTKDTWIDKLPAKILKWSFLTLIGLLAEKENILGHGLAISLGLSAGDAFLLDRILKGWKPNVFVDKQLKPFVF